MIIVWIIKYKFGQKIIPPQRSKRLNQKNNLDIVGQYSTLFNALGWSLLHDDQQNIYIEGPSGLAFQGDTKITRPPKDSKFLRARPKPIQDKLSWKLFQLNGWSETETDVYFIDGGKWHIARSREVVRGSDFGRQDRAGKYFVIFVPWVRKT